MIKLKYNSIKDIPLKVFTDIQETYDIDDEIDRDMEIASILTGKPIDELNKLTMTQWTELSVKIGEIFTTVDVPTDMKIDYLDINGDKYFINYDLSKFSVAQYIDFQNYLKIGGKDLLVNLLSTFIVPKGKFYNTDYDLNELKNTINNNISYYNASCIVNFISRSSKNLIQATLKSLLSTKEVKMNSEMSKMLQELNKQIGLL